MATEKEKPATTPIHVPRDTWFLLRQVALRRSLERGSRVSLGEVVDDLVRRHRKELEREIA